MTTIQVIIQPKRSSLIWESVSLQFLLIVVICKYLFILRNVIENAWYFLKSRLHKIPFTSIEKLQRDAQKIWRAVPIGYCHALVDSMKTRLDKILDNDGLNTKYG